MKKTLSPKRHAKGLWWDRNWPVLEGCTPCSPACDNCFASGYAHRFENSLPYLRGLTTRDGKWNGSVVLRKDQFQLPSTIKEPTAWFVTERSDLFHPAVPFEYILAVLSYAVMAPQHRYMILTKRPERMAEFFKWMDTEATHRVETMRDCFWFGVTVWDQNSADRNIPFLLGLPVAHRFVSVEPMLGLVDIKMINDSAALAEIVGGPTIDLVICGGESGRNARPVHPDWIRSLRDQCSLAGVPFFFKQWGEWEVASEENGHRDHDMERNKAFWVAMDGTIHKPSSKGLTNPIAMARVGKKAAGRLIDGKEYLELPL